jgi:hypothetical protein
VTRNGGVGLRHRSISTSPSRTTLAASDPGVDHPQFPSFSAEIARTTLFALKTGSISDGLILRVDEHELPTSSRQYFAGCGSKMHFHYACHFLAPHVATLFQVFAELVFR